MRTALLRVCVVTLVAAAMVPVVALLVIYLAWRYPSSSELPEARPVQAGQPTRVYDKNGVEIGQLKEFDQHIPVSPADIPRHLKQAVVAAEDRSFYSHAGVDFGALLRALWADLKANDFVQGGSTITQQYVRNTYTGRERTVGRKLREVALASRLSHTMDKEEILFKYLSSIYLGEGAYGVGAASETYFRKPVSKITLSEAALLAGLIPAPSRFEPRGNPGLAEERRQMVLDQMRGQGFISDAEHARASSERVSFVPGGAPDRSATVIHPNQSGHSKYPYFMDYVRRYLLAKYDHAMVFRGGLEVRTTIDPRMQAAAETAVTDALRGTTPPIEVSLVAVEPRTGYVRAMVGGRDFAASGGQVNLALGGCPQPPQRFRLSADVPATCWDEKSGVAVAGGGTGRQAGSAWKPFVLAAALNKGIPESQVYAAPGSYRVPGCQGARCTIQNYEGSGAGAVNLRTATEQSINTVYAQLIGDVGIKETAEMAKKLGITSAWAATPEVHGISYAIGVQEVSPLDMASAFGVFGNGGVRQEATPAEWIKAGGDKFVEDNRSRSGRSVITSLYAAQMTDILRGVIARGTGTRANIGRPAAGKTGTAQEWQDAWFVGYTPDLSAAVWIGDRERPRPLLGVKGVPRVTGGSIPAMTWNAFMTAALAGVPPTDFPPLPAALLQRPPPLNPNAPGLGGRGAPPPPLEPYIDPYATTSTIPPDLRRYYNPYATSTLPPAPPPP